MHVKPRSTSKPVDNSHVLSVTDWQIILSYLLQRYYGLTLNDTPFCEATVIQRHLDAAISLTDALNFMVEKYDLVRTDRHGFSHHEQSPYINRCELLRAQHCTRHQRVQATSSSGESVAYTDNRINPSQSGEKT